MGQTISQKSDMIRNILKNRNIRWEEEVTTECFQAK